MEIKMTKETYNEINSLVRRLTYLVSREPAKAPPYLRQTFCNRYFIESDFMDIANKPYQPDQKEINFEIKHLLRQLSIADSTEPNV